MKDAIIIYFMVPEHKITQLIAAGYFILDRNEKYCHAIKVIDGKEKYVLLEYQDSNWIVLRNGVE